MNSPNVTKSASRARPFDTAGLAGGDNRKLKFAKNYGQAMQRRYDAELESLQVMTDVYNAERPCGCRRQLGRGAWCLTASPCSRRGIPFDYSTLVRQGGGGGGGGGCSGGGDGGDGGGGGAGGGPGGNRSSRAGTSEEDARVAKERERIEREIQVKLREIETHEQTSIELQTDQTASSVQNMQPSIDKAKERSDTLRRELTALHRKLWSLEDDAGGGAGTHIDPDDELLEGDDEAIGSLPLEDSDDEGGDAAGAISDDDMFDNDGP